jgi:GTP-binding protein
VLVDSRHGLKPVDHEVMDMLDAAAVSYHLVLTKTDKIKPPAAAKLVEDTGLAIVRRPAAYPQILSTSSEKAAGIAELREAIMKAITA